MNSIVFAFDDDASDGDALLVANTGEKFTRKGVVSICNMDLSAKTTDSIIEPDDGEYDELNTKLVCSILEKRIKEYEGDINRLKEDVNREKGVRKSYTGRFVWELLQNADDAMDTNRSNANLIGAKGIGFKSVLEITDEPEIYSGDFCFHFSREKSREVLKEKTKWSEGIGIPVCRLPHPKKPGPTVRKLLDEGYATVLRLPLNEGKREMVGDELSRFCSRSLLFCQCIETIAMQAGTAPRHIKVHRGNKGRIELIENDHSTYWQVWDDKKKVEGEKRLSVRMCLPVVDGKIDCIEDVPRLYVFFPTAEQVPDVYALIHVSCEVEDNRQHLANLQIHQDEICKMLAGITKRILSKILPDVALRAFGRAQIVENADDGVAIQLRNAIATAVQETAFIPLIGGSMAKPGDVRLWKHGLGNAIDPRKVKDQNLCHPYINNDEESAEILSRLDAKHASNPELARLLRFCRNKNGKHCLMAWNVAQSLMASVNQQSEKDKCEAELLKAPFWLVNNGKVKARSINGEIPLVAIKPKGLPKWLRIDVIDKNFRRLIQNEIEQHQEACEDWEDALSRSLQLPENKQGYFNHILLPYCRKLTLEEWQKNGRRVLKMAFEWGKKDGKDEPFIIGSDNTELQKRAEIFHLPVGKGNQKWVPAWQCYAGAAWGGPKIFDKYFAGVEDRYVLSPPADDRRTTVANTNKKKWDKLLSWLGCSWMLKIKRKNGLHPERDDVCHTPGRPFSDFCFEHFDEMFATPQNEKASDYMPLLNMIPEMYKIASKEKACYFYYASSFVESYALRQLKKNEWVPCKQSLLFPNKRFFRPEDAYLPGFSLNRLLPEWNKHNLDHSARDAVEKTLKKLGAKNSISKNPQQLIRYMKQLSQSHSRTEENLRWEKNDEDRGKIARAAKAIFSAYAKIENHPSLTGDVRVPCLRNTKKGEILCFEKAGNVYWADKPYFNETGIRKEILDADKFHVFFLFLKDGEPFGLNKLSKHLRLEPKYGSKNPEAARVLRERYDSRRVGMAKATDQNLPEQLEVVAYDNIALHATAHAKITIPKIKFWKRDECEIDINAGANMWQGLAAALGELTNGSQYKPDFELLLKEKTWESFRDRLRDDYDLTEESITEVDNSALSDDNNSDVAENDMDAEQETGPGDSANEPSSSGAHLPRSTSGGGFQGTTNTTASSENNVGENRSRSKPQPEVPEIEVVPDYSWGPERSGANRPGVGNDASDGEYEARDSDGKRGEEALLKWLKGKFGSSNVTNKNETHPNHPGYDILVVKNGEEHYYECKSFVSATPPRRVSMTKAQFEKAASAPNRYWLCVIYNIKADSVSAQMLKPRNPATHENEPVVSEYKIDLTSWKSNTE